MSDATSAPRRGKSSPPAGKPLGKKGYLANSSLPLTSLVFLLPFIITYELGMRPNLTNPVHLREIYAFKLMREFFQWFGATGRYMPAMAVVGILITWHIARNDSWKIHWPSLVGMFFESVFLGIPLIFIAHAFAQYVPLYASPTAAEIWQQIVLSLGAGIYEELVFRLCGLTLMSMMIMDVAKIRNFWGKLIVVLVPAILFSLYHYMGNEVFTWRTFLFRTTAGVYFGVIFLCRGFGITAGSHAAYDVLAALLPLHMAG